MRIGKSDTGNAKCYKNAEEPGALIHCMLSYKIKHTLITCHLSTSSTLPKLKTCSHKTFTIIYSNFIIAKTWKPSRFPSIDDWIDKLVKPMKYYLLLKEMSY